MFNKIAWNAFALIQVSKKSHLLLFFLLILNIINMIDRTLLASFGSDIISDLNLTDSQFGLLTGLAFVFFYSLMGLLMGALADRFHRPRLIAFGLVLWSGLTLLSGMAKNFFQISIARLFIGIGESGGNIWGRGGSFSGGLPNLRKPLKYKGGLFGSKKYVVSLFLKVVVFKFEFNVIACLRL